MYAKIFIHTYVCMCIYTHIYIERERYESQKRRNMANSIHTLDLFLNPHSQMNSIISQNYLCWQIVLPLTTYSVSLWLSFLICWVDGRVCLLGLPWELNQCSVCGTQGSAWYVSISSYNVKITLWCIKHPLFATSQCSVEAALWSPRLFT